MHYGIQLYLAFVCAGCAPVYVEKCAPEPGTMLAMLPYVFSTLSTNDPSRLVFVPGWPYILERSNHTQACAARGTLLACMCLGVKMCWNLEWGVRIQGKVNTGQILDVHHLKPASLGLWDYDFIKQD